MWNLQCTYVGSTTYDQEVATRLIISFDQPVVGAVAWADHRNHRAHIVFNPGNQSKNEKLHSSNLLSPRSTTASPPLKMTPWQLLLLHLYGSNFETLTCCPQLSDLESRLRWVRLTWSFQVHSAPSLSTQKQWAAERTKRWNKSGGSGDKRKHEEKWWHADFKDIFKGTGFCCQSSPAPTDP